MESANRFNSRPNCKRQFISRGSACSASYFVCDTTRTVTIEVERSRRFDGKPGKLENQFGRFVTPERLLSSERGSSSLHAIAILHNREDDSSEFCLLGEGEVKWRRSGNIGCVQRRKLLDERFTLCSQQLYNCCKSFAK